MTHSKSYLVTTNQANSSPQNHVTGVTKEVPTTSWYCRSNGICSGWMPFVLTGMAAIAFLIGIYGYGNDRVFPATINIYSGQVPIVHGGYLQAFPFTIKSDRTNQNTFKIDFPLNKSEESAYTKALDQLLKNYPDKYEESYTNCWLENPTKNSPCFYDRTWITSLCRNDKNFGYAEVSGEYNPCFILKFDNPGDWEPKLPLFHTLRLYDAFSYEEYDHGFIPVICRNQGDNSRIPSIKIYPPKGFSRLYFPVSSFNKTSYLPPLLAVKVKGIQKNTTVTINCSVISPNAFVLWNNGIVSITFSAS